MLRSTGDALTPGLISVLTCILDVIFSYVLINPTRTILLAGHSITVFGFGWGVPGAALGTALSNVVGGLLALALLLFRDGVLCIRRPGSWRITKACLQNLWKVGAPLAAERAALSSAQVPLVRTVSGLGTAAMAANSSASTKPVLRRWATASGRPFAMKIGVAPTGVDMAKHVARLCTGTGHGHHGV